MLHTPLKHTSPGHAPAQHPLSTTRCSPHNAQSHELNFTDWLHMSPAQVALMSSASVAQSPAAHFSPPSPFYGPQPNPNSLQYSVRGDFMTTSPLPYSPPFAHPYSVVPSPNSNFSIQVPIISVEDTQHTPHFPSSSQKTGSTPGDGPIPRSFSDYLSYTSETKANSVSPVSHQLVDAESTPVTTMSGVDDASQSQPASGDEPEERTFLERLRAVSPDTPASITPVNSNSPAPARKEQQQKPIESIESPFRIAQPQPRTFTPLHSSPLTELAEVASRQPTPSQPGSRPGSRPSSALSTHSAKSQKVQRRLPLAPHRFEPSPLQVRLPHMSSSSATSLADTLAENQRGPLEFGEEGHRYRTRSKLKNFKAELQDRERREDLALIRKGLKGSSEDASSLELLASVSETRLMQIDVDDSPVPSKPPAKLKRGTKRTLKDFDDAESVTSTSTANDAKHHTPSKRPKVERKKAIEKQAVTDAPKMKTRGAAVARSAPISHPVRVANSKEKVDAVRQTISVAPRATNSATPDRRSTRRSKPTQFAQETDGESELTSISDAEYESEPTPEKKRKVSRKAIDGPRPVKKLSDTNLSSTLIPVDDSPLGIPTRTFPQGIHLHPSFPLLYRKFPMCGYVDPQGTHPIAPPGPLPGGHFNAPRSAEDLYTPRFVRGIGRDKAGLCPICYESKERGGAGKADWLSMKFSAFNYHMQYAHGISPTTTLPFSPPVAFRSTIRKPNHKNEKTELLEGQCHRCREWVPVEGVKCVEAKLKEIYWWKHAAQCHKGYTIEGETDVHLDDEVSQQILAAVRAYEPPARFRPVPAPCNSSSIDKLLSSSRK